MPRISVVIVLERFDRSAEEMFEQLRNQSFRRWEALVICLSEDVQTMDELAALEQSDKRFRIMLSDVPSLAEARNLGVWHARAEIVVFMGSHEVWNKSNLAVLAAVLADESGAAAVIGSDYQIKADRYVTAAQLISEVEYHRPLAVAFRREAYLNTGGVPVTCSVGHVHEWLVRLAAFGGEIRQVPTFLVSVTSPCNFSRTQWRRSLKVGLSLGVKIDPLILHVIEGAHIRSLADRAAHTGALRRTICLAWNRQAGLTFREKIYLSLMALYGRRGPLGECVNWYFRRMETFRG
ncbi:MAG: glycosyltransferase family 2 protein [Pikeienuella sp.]